MKIVFLVYMVVVTEVLKFCSTLVYQRMPLQETYTHSQKPNLKLGACSLLSLHLSCFHQYLNISIKISLSSPVCLSAYSPCSWETYSVNSDCPIMLGLSGNQQGAWSQRSHSSPALLPGSAVSFWAKRKKQIDFFPILHKPRDKSDVRMKINASFTPNNVQKETCVHAQYIMGTFSWQGNLYARSEHHSISNKHWIIHTRTHCLHSRTDATVQISLWS